MVVKFRLEFVNNHDDFGGPCRSNGHRRAVREQRGRQPGRLDTFDAPVLLENGMTGAIGILHSDAHRLVHGLFAHEHRVIHFIVGNILRKSNGTAAPELARTDPPGADGPAVIPQSRVFELAVLLALRVHHTDLARVPDECNRAGERYNDQHQH